MSKVKIKSNRKRLFVIALILLLIMGALGICKALSGHESADGNTLEVHFIDVGHGDCILLKCADNAMLIDAGEDDDGTKVQYYLQNQGVNKLDYLILTHPDKDHIGGADVIVTKFDIGKIMMSPYKKDKDPYNDLMKAIKYRNYSYTCPQVGERFDFAGGDFVILGPCKEYDDSNNSSIVLKYRFGNTSFLFSGDAQKEAEADIVQNGLDITADVYKVGHHGSSGSSTKAFLEKINPKYAVISCASDDGNGHPHIKPLKRLAKRGVKLYRTDVQGTVIAYSDGNIIKWNKEPTDNWNAGVK